MHVHIFNYFNPWVLSILIIWSLVWKGIALWHATRNGQTAWYVVMLIVNTVGILEIIYLLFFRPKKTSEAKNP